MQNTSMRHSDAYTNIGIYPSLQLCHLDSLETGWGGTTLQSLALSVVSRIGAIKNNCIV